MSDFQVVASDPPPSRSARPDSEKKSEPRERKSTEINLIVKGLEQTYSGIGIGLMMVSPADAAVVANNAHDLAESWRPLLENNAKVRASFRKMMEAGGWSTVIFTHAMILAPILQNHKSSFSHLFNGSKKRETVQQHRMGQAATAPN